VWLDSELRFGQSARVFGRRRKLQIVSAVEPSSPGWDAITGALERLYPGVVPRHLAPMPGPAFGGGVQGISAYPNGDHWHLVTYGLSELYAKESEDPDRSGWGFELTIRVGPMTDEPPLWAFNLLERIAQETRHAGTVFSVGHRLDSQSPIDGDRSPFTALAFTLDPTLGTLATVNGRLDFIQVVGITANELVEMKASSTESVLTRIGATNTYLATDPAR